MSKRRIKWTWSLLFALTAIGFIYFTDIRPGLSRTVNKNPCHVDLPQPKGYVSDFTHLFTATEISTLDSIIIEHEKQTTNQVAIITVDTSMLGKCDLDQYIINILNKWGVGQKDKNNGIVIGIAPLLGKMSIRNGYGIEKKMTDAETKTIIDSTFIPFFKHGRYFDGTKSGLFAIFEQVR